jgi:hypothetical protein
LSQSNSDVDSQQQGLDAAVHLAHTPAGTTHNRRTMPESGHQPPVPRPGVTPELRLIEVAIWRELVRAPQHREHGWRHMVMASLDHDGVDARTLVLRECDDVERELVFYTDARSPKLDQLRAAPRAMLVTWSTDLGWQLRLRCRFEVATHGLGVASRWARIRCTPAAQDYLFPLPSGTAMPQPLPPAGSDAEVAQEAPPPPLEHHHFAVLTARVEVIDWLELGSPRHRRARFDARGASWIAP